MGQALGYLVIVMYIALFVGFVMILWQLIAHGQWKMALLCIAFLPVCFGGLLLALILGWQEADRWKMKNLMRWYSALFVVCFVVFVNDSIYAVRHPVVVEDPNKGKIKLKVNIR